MKKQNDSKLTLFHRLIRSSLIPISIKVGESILVFLLYCVLTVVIFHHRFVGDRLSTHYTMPDVDTDTGIWFQWFLHSIGEQQLIYEVIDLTAYPIGFDISNSPVQNLVYDVHVGLLNLFGYSWQNLLLISNLSSLIVYPASGLTAYWTGVYLTKNKRHSFLFGIYYAFAFYIVYMGRGSMSINHIELIPLVFLSMFYFLEKRTIWALLLSSFLIAIQFKADAYYAFWCGLFSPILFFFYTSDNLKISIRRFVLYCLSVITSVVALNFAFVLQQYEIMTTPSLLRQTGRNSQPLNELTSLAYYFSLPLPKFNLLHEIIGRFAYFVYLPIKIAPFLSVFVLHKDKRVQAVALCWVLSVALSALVPPLFVLNLLYFQFFGMFRSVSRLSHFVTFFSGLLILFFFNWVEKNHNIKKGRLYAGLLVTFTLINIIANLNTDITWRRTTNFQKLVDLYHPLDNLEVTGIAPYPFDLNGGDVGFPTVYQLVSQVAHQRPFASGISQSKSESAVLHQSEIRDIRDPKTIDALIKYNINTILVYNQIQPDAQQINLQLQSDPRVRFVGRFTTETDQTYISANDLSRDISIYQLDLPKDKTFRRDFKLEAFDETSFEYTKENAYLFSIRIQPNTQPVTLDFYAPHSPKWKLYRKSDEFTFMNIMLGRAVEISQSLDAEKQLKNSWILLPDYLEKNAHDEYILMFESYPTVFVTRYIEKGSIGVFVITLLLLARREFFVKKLKG